MNAVRSARPAPRSIAALIRLGARRFRDARLTFGHGTTNARDEAASLACHALGLPPAPSPAQIAAPLEPRDVSRVLRLFERRVRERAPAAYLTGSAWLEDLRFHVNRQVIVPRSHIAGLLRDRLAPWLPRGHRIRSALDLCTGSGCLAILLARAIPEAKVDAADLSASALAVARRNLRDHRMGRRIRLIRSDLFGALQDRQYDLIVSNPPYVPSAAMRRLPAEYRHEPRLALAGGRDGLDLVRRIVAEAANHLRPDGMLVVEVGNQQARVERAFPRIAFEWPDLPGDGAVFVVRRDQLPR